MKLGRSGGVDRRSLWPHQGMALLDTLLGWAIGAMLLTVTVMAFQGQQRSMQLQSRLEQVSESVRHVSHVMGRLLHAAQRIHTDSQADLLALEMPATDTPCGPLPVGARLQIRFQAGALICNGQALLEGLVGLRFRYVYLNTSGTGAPLRYLEALETDATATPPVAVEVQSDWQVWPGQTETIHLTLALRAPVLHRLQRGGV